MPFINGAVAYISKYKQGFFFSPQFIGANSWNGYEHKLLFESLGAGVFSDVARPMGCDALEDGRAVAIADFNGDGRLDLVISNNNAAPTIYVNNQGRAGNWLRVDLGGAGPDCARDPLGARVDVVVDHDGCPRTITRWVEAGAGYSAQSEYMLHFGLGAAPSVEALLVTWPGLPTRRFTRDQLGDVRNETIAIEGATARVRKRPAGAITAREARGPVRGQWASKRTMR